MGAIELTYSDIAIAGVMVLLVGLASFVLQLNLEKKLFVAALRTVLQLSLVGYILKLVFDIESVVPLLGVVAVMVVVAARTAVKRPERTYRGVDWSALLGLAVSGLIVVWVVTHLIVGVEPWYKPQYLIPLLGMVLGNSLNGISICLDAFLNALVVCREEVEMELAMGATAWEAARKPLRDSIRRGMIPTLNTMMVVGVVSLPGMMTGQILQGADPLNAVKYQIVIMFSISVAVAVGSSIVAVIAWRKLFDGQHRFLYDKISRR